MVRSISLSALQVAAGVGTEVDLSAGQLDEGGVNVEPEHSELQGRSNLPSIFR